MSWKHVGWLGSSTLIAGSAVLAAGFAHAHAYRLRRRAITLPYDSKTAHESPTKTQRGDKSSNLRVLHLSDTHLLHTQQRRQKFLKSLATQKPDLLVLTGDLIAENAAIDPLLAALAEFQGVPGVYVYGSNDYYAPRPKNPFSYLFHSSKLSKKTPPRRLDTTRLTAGLDRLGFLNLNNATAQISLGNWDLEFIGVDDPHIGRAKFPPNKLDMFVPQAQTSVPSRKTLRIGLTHAPYQKVLQKMYDMGYEIVFAGHTHGGQVCLPGARALVTNCDLPPEYAAGLFSWPLPQPPRAQLRQQESMPQDSLPENNATLGINAAANPTASAAVQVAPKEKMLFQISAGIGTSPFAQIRTFCPPEAIQIDIRKA